MTVAANRSLQHRTCRPTCLDLICSYTGWPVGHVYLRAKDRRRNCFRWESGTWPMPAGSRPSARPAIAAFRPGAGLPARSSGFRQTRMDRRFSGSRTIAASQRGGTGWAAVGIRVSRSSSKRRSLEFWSSFRFRRSSLMKSCWPSWGILDRNLGQVIIRQRAEQELQSAKGVRRIRE